MKTQAIGYICDKLSLVGFFGGGKTYPKSRPHLLVSVHMKSFCLLALTLAGNFMYPSAETFLHWY